MVQYAEPSFGWSLRSRTINQVGAGPSTFFLVNSNFIYSFSWKMFSLGGIDRKFLLDMHGLNFLLPSILIRRFRPISKSRVLKGFLQGRFVQLIREQLFCPSLLRL